MRLQVEFERELFFFLGEVSVGQKKMKKFLLKNLLCWIKKFVLLRLNRHVG